ncbi:MAG: amidohydrolase family protein [Planctomycetales bacterium]|nr:amidohydrolase family protein [Planctomycetales bacterium]
MRIDSHHHFWNYSPEQYPWIGPGMAVLRSDYGPRQLQAEINATGINSVVSVQARQSIEETDWLLEIATDHEFVAGVVGWLPLADDSLRSELERLVASPKLKALRHVVQDEPDDQFILGREFNLGVGLLKQFDLVYDILIFAKHLSNTVRFVDQHPEQQFVLDHIAKPTITAESFDDQWAADLRELAKRENVACKFSGVVTEVRQGHWSIETIRPYWVVALESFGPRRLMFGSDWPVCLLQTDYVRWVHTVQQLASELSTTEQDQFWRGTALATYKL